MATAHSCYELNLKSENIFKVNYKKTYKRFWTLKAATERHASSYIDTRRECISLPEIERRKHLIILAMTDFRMYADSLLQ